MSSHDINMLIRTTLGVLGVVLITVIMVPEKAFATHRSFREAEKWTEYEFYGDHGTFFADLNGDGKADAIGVNNDAIWYRLSTGSRFEGDDTNGKKQLTKTPFYGDVLYKKTGNPKEGTFFADVDGDEVADPIAVYEDKDMPIIIRESSTEKRNPWTAGAFYGQVDTFFADVDGDGRADAIAVNTSNVVVKRSVLKPNAKPTNKYEFGKEEVWLQHDFSPGKREVFFANVANITDEEKLKGKADLIVVKEDGVRVWYSYGGRFRAEKQEEGDLWTYGPFPAFYGTLSDPKYQATFFADVNGDGQADTIAINDGTRIVGDHGIAVRESIKNGAFVEPPWPGCGRVDLGAVPLTDFQGHSTAPVQKPMR